MSDAAVTVRDEAVQAPAWRLPIPAPAHAALVLVAAGYCLMVFLRTSQTMSLTFDEVIYASQVSVETPATGYGAPRARGMSLLLAPVVAITEWVPATRVYLGLLAGLLMYAAYVPWVRFFQGRYRYIPAVAAGCFATLWITVLYGNLGYPNLWLAFTVVAGAGWYVRAATETRLVWWPIVATAAWFAAASLLRPTDSLAAAGPLLLAAVVVPSWRRLWPPLAVAAGLAVGWIPWIAEAYARFGGPIARLRSGAETNRSGLVNSVPEHLDALDGPAVLCRPHSLCAGVEWTTTVWWLALPLLVGAGLLVARSHRWLATGSLLTASAVALAIPYLFLIDYAAPRFLLPSYGLLAVIVAGAVMGLTELRNAELRVLMAVLAAGALLVHIGVQQRILATADSRLVATSERTIQVAEFLRDEQGVRPPCLLWGEGAIQLSYLLKCRGLWRPDRAPEHDDPDIAAALARGDLVVVRMRADLKLPVFMAGWRRVEHPGNGRVVAYLPFPGG